jgi:hypothetical protein
MGALSCRPGGHDPQRSYSRGGADRASATITCMDLVELLAARYLARGDAWVEQGTGGGFAARRGLLGAEAISRHLAGDVSLHAYALAPAGRPPLLPVDSALWGALDIDVMGEATASARQRAMETLRELHGAVTGLVGGGPVVLEETGGRGLHLWVHFEERVPAAQVMRLMDAVLALSGRAAGTRTQEDVVAVERYPKQEALRGRVGSSLRVPLGVHPKTGRRSVFISSNGAPVAPEVALVSPLAWSDFRSIVNSLPARKTPPACPPSRRAMVEPPRIGQGDRVVRPGAWETYAWLATRLGLADRTTRPPTHTATRHSVRCLFPDRHAHGDRSGSGSAYLILDGEAQLYGCAVCLDEAIDSLELIRRAVGVAEFSELLSVAQEVDPFRCRGRGGESAGAETMRQRNERSRRRI